MVKQNEKVCQAQNLGSHDCQDLSREFVLKNHVSTITRKGLSKFNTICENGKTKLEGHTQSFGSHYQSSGSQLQVISSL